MHASVMQGGGWITSVVRLRRQRPSCRKGWLPGGRQGRGVHDVLWAMYGIQKQFEGSFGILRKLVPEADRRGLS